MNIKRILLAAIAAAFAFAALPALAVADEVHYEDPHFTISGGATTLESGAGVNCSSVTGTGEFENSETGTITFVSHGCKAFGTNCQSGGTTGTITTTELTFHVERVTYGEGEDTPATLVTPNTTDTEVPHFATFKCAGGLVTVVVRGNGVIGHVLDGYNVSQSTYEVEFATNEEGTDQEFTTVVGDEEDYRLESSLNGGKFNPAYQIGLGNIHGENAEFTTN